MRTTIDISAAYEGTSPKLSVLVPFYRDDASILLRDLDVQISGNPIEVLFYDDGTGDPALTEKMRGGVGALKALSNSSPMPLTKAVQARAMDYSRPRAEIGFSFLMQICALLVRIS